jgi:3-phenylpropionate/trans-cinnamate dioxygenase ferredoxin reductase component
MSDTTVTAIDPSGSRVTLGDGQELSFDRLLLATGAEPRRVEVPGVGLAGVHYLRTLADCDVLRAQLVEGARVAVIGAGWIGSEFAASARQRGLDVTVIEPLDLPYERILGPEIGAFYRDVHVQHGVEMLLGHGLDAFEGDGTVSRVLTSVGDVVECDFAVVGIGIAPRTQLAADAGLEVDNGVVTNEHLETSASGIFAAGDVVNAWHPFYEERVRVEHWANALNQGPAAARSMLDDDKSYDRIPYFYSDQYDVGMEYSGYATSWDEVVFRGDRDGGEFVAFWLRDGLVVGGMNVNVWDVNQYVQALIRSRRPVDVAALTDLSTPLESLVGEPAP